MPIFPVKISRFVKDYDKTFWGGSADLSIEIQKLAQALEGNPAITVAGLRGKLSDSLLSAKIALGAGTGETLQIGERAGLALDVSLRADVEQRLDIVLAQGGLAGLPDTHPLHPKKGIGDGTVLQLDADEALVILFLHGSIAGELGGSTLHQPALDVGFQLKAGGSYEWVYSRPAGDDAVVIDAVKETFSRARLPQTRPVKVVSAGQAVTPKKNEVIYSRHTGFMNLGVQASYGYSFSGVKDYSIGKLDLATKFRVQAAASLKASYQLAGAFRIAVLAGSEPGWTRVLVDKDRSSTFGFAFGVKVGVELETPGAKGGLELIESLLGASSYQVLDKALGYAQMTPEEIENKIDGFTRALTETWTNKAFEQIGDDLQVVLDKLGEVKKAVDNVDDDLLGLYEKFLERVDLASVLDDLRQNLDRANPDDELEQMKDRLIGQVGNADVKRLVEGLADNAIGNVVTRLADERQKILDRIGQLETLVTGTAREAIREFVQARLDALDVDELFAKLAEYDTKKELRDKASAEVQELVERLAGTPFKEFIEAGGAKKRIKQLNRLAVNFQSTLEKIGDQVQNALNSKGRFELGYGYRRVKSNRRLIDVEIKTGDAGAPDAQGMRLYRNAVAGNFTEVFRDEHLERLRIRSAEFTDRLVKTSTLDVHIFGWDYRGVFETLSNLDARVEVGDSGLLTVYNLSAGALRKRSSRKRETDLNYLFTVVGTARGAFTSKEDLLGQSVNLLKEFRSTESSLRYAVTDELTTLDELPGYFWLGRQMQVISQEELDELVKTLSELRSGGMGIDNYGKVGVKYTFGFDGDALADALARDYSQDSDLAADNNTDALQQLLVDRIVASYYVNPRAKAKQFPAIPGIYLGGALKDFRKSAPNPNATPRAYGFKWKGKAKQIQPAKGQVRAAYSLYVKSLALAKFLERFRVALETGEVVPLAELDALLKGLSKKTVKIAKGNPNLDVLPFLLMDEMVRRSSGGDSDARSAFMEVALYDRAAPDEALHYIPIAG